jgi:hypothetical protein
MSDRGFVQILVLGALATLAALVGAAMMLARTDSTHSAALERLVRTDVLVTSGFRRTMAALGSPTDDFETLALEGDAGFPLGDVSTNVRIDGENGKIDVLLSDPVLMQQLAGNAGVSPADIRQLADAVAAMREQSDGAGALDAARGVFSPYLPSFAEAVTRFGGAGIDPTYASADVLSAIPDLSPSDAARIAATPAAERSQLVSLSRYFTSNSRRFSIVVSIDWGLGETATRRLPIEISTSGQPIILAGAY